MIKIKRRTAMAAMVAFSLIVAYQQTVMRLI